VLLCLHTRPDSLRFACKIPRTLTSSAKIVDGVYFIPRAASMARGNPAFRYQCLHPSCTKPLHAGHLSRHVRRHHVQSYNAFRINGEMMSVPENWVDCLLGPIWESAHTGEHRALCTDEAAAATQHEAVPPPQPPAEKPLQAPHEHVDGILTAGHGAHSAAAPASNTGVCLGARAWVR
jgi:hypothetical protein